MRNRQLVRFVLLAAVCSISAVSAGCAQIARGQTCGPAGCQPSLLHGPTVPIRFPARPPKQTYATGEAAIDHSQFVTRGELAKWTDATKANVQKTADAVNQVNEHSQSVGVRVEELDTQVKQHVAGLAEQIAGVNNDVADKVGRLKQDLPELVKTPAGQAATEAAKELITQAAGAQALPLLTTAAAMGGPPAVVLSIVGWLILRRLKMNLSAPKSGGAGGAAGDPFRGADRQSAGRD